MNVQLLEPTHRVSESVSGLMDRNARSATPAPEAVRTAAKATSRKEEPVAAEEKAKKAKFAKGSEEAKAHMAALRAKRAETKAEKPAKEKKAKAAPNQTEPVSAPLKRVKGKKVAEEAPAPPAAKPKKKKIVQVEIEVSDSE